MRGNQHLEREMDVATRAAAAAAALLEARSGADRVEEKGRADLVTEVDRAAERAIIDIVSSEFPDDAIVAEESSREQVEGKRRWIVDPLDGTVNYVHSHPFACVSIALVDESGPAVAVVHAPFLDELYHAARGGGAWLNGSPVRVSSTPSGEAGLFATGFPFKEGKGDPDAYFRLIADVVASSHGVRRAGAAALDLAFVAAGRLDGFFEIGLGPWDIAAGILLVTEAGGTTGGWPGDDLPPLRTGRIIASNGITHGWLESRITRFVPPL